MLDVRTTTAEIQNIAEAPLSPAHVAIRREDYRPPDWLVPELKLDFDLGIDRTRVRATLSVQRNGEHDRPLRLDGDEVKLQSVMVDRADGKWRLEGEQLVIEIDEDSATVETDV